MQADGIGYFAGTKQVTVGDIPAAPSGLSAAAVSGHEVNLTWTDNSNIEVGYLIEQSPDGENDWVPVAWTDGSSTYHSLPGPFAPSTDYYFRVKAFTESAQSQYSNVADVTTGAWPEAPTGLFAWASSDTQIELTWTDNSSGADIILQRSEDGIVWSDVTITDNESATDSGLTPGAAYQYRVFACNSNGESGYATLRAAAIAAPTGLSVEARSGHEINLSWTDNSAAELYYLIEVSLSGTGDWELIGYAEADAESITLEGPFEPNTTYYFRVAAVGQDWTIQSGFSPVADDTTGDFPAAPSDLEATVEYSPNLRVHLTWTDNSGDETFTLQRYDGSSWVTVDDNIADDQTDYDDDDVEEGFVYVYRLFAQNGNGASAYAAPSASGTPVGAIAPAAPTGLGASGNGPINVSWNDAVGTGPFRYSLYRDKYGQTPSTTPYIAGLTTNSYTDTRFDYNTQYVYRVQAVGQAGAGTISNPTSPVLTKPGRVSGVAALWKTAQGGNYVHVTWSQMAGMGSYVVERSTDGGEFAVVSEAQGDPDDDGQLKDYNASTTGSHLYRVKAVNTAGSGAYSASTSPANVLVPVKPTLRIDGPAIAPTPVPPLYYLPAYPDPYQEPNEFEFTTNVPSLVNRRIYWGDTAVTDYGTSGPIEHDPGYSAEALVNFEVRAVATGSMELTADMNVAAVYFEDFDDEPLNEMSEWSPTPSHDPLENLVPTGGNTYSYGWFFDEDVVTLSLGGTGADALPEHVALDVAFSFDVTNPWPGQDDHIAVTVDGITRKRWYTTSESMVFPHTGDSVSIQFEGHFQENDPISGWMMHHITVTPLFADASVDSFNDKAHGSGGAGYVPGYRLQADTIENKPGEPGVYVAVDDGDFDGDGIPGFADGFDLDGAASDDDSSEDAPLYQLVLTFPLGIGQHPPRIKLEYSASDPEAMAANPTWPDTAFELPEEGLIRIWRRDTYGWIGMAAMADWTSGLQGDFVAAGVGYTERDLEAGSYVENGRVTLYIQGVRPGMDTIEFWVDVDGDDEDYVLADTVKYSAVAVDLAIDSLNRNGPFGTALAPNSAAGQLQDQLEAHASFPGKIIVTNIDDDDGDGIVDWADGFDVDGVNGNADDAVTGLPSQQAEQFVPLRITLPEPIDLAKARLQISYDASDPGAVIRVAPARASDPFTYAAPAGGTLRLWTVDGSEPRSLEPFYAGGSYVPPRYSNESDDSTDTGAFDPHFYGPQALSGLFSSGRSATLWVEAVKPGTTTITVRIDPDGEGPARFMLVDSVRVTAVRIDLDVDGNSSLDDAVDGATNYLPGYEGATAKVSTGATFNTASYTGQEMKLMVEGLGAGMGLSDVGFRILGDVTRHEGYAVNASSAAVEGAGKTDDFSFLASADRREADSTQATPAEARVQMGEGKTTVPFWAKDYGGWARIQVWGAMLGNSFLMYEFTVPLDSDGDKIADKWERDMDAAWLQQYGAAHQAAAGTYLFGPGEDAELRDPDGAGNSDGGADMPDHHAEGDSLTVAQEYRGFILDGGGHDWNGENAHTGGHARLSPVYKELMAETDIMAGCPHMPTLADLKDKVLNKVAKGFSDKSEGAGIRFYWVIDETAAAPHTVFGSAVAMAGWAAPPRRNTLLREFVHLMFVDDGTFLGFGAGGGSGTPGSFIFTTAMWNDAVPYGDFPANLPRTTAHEITHLLMDTANRNGFDGLEHELDPDPRDPPQSPLDKIYVMYPRNAANRLRVTFSDVTRKQIDLTRKESVER